MKSLRPHWHLGSAWYCHIGLCRICRSIRRHSKTNRR